MAQNETTSSLQNDHSDHSDPSEPVSDYLADYHRHYGEERVPNSYIVTFNEGHTVAKHVEFLGRSFEMFELAANIGYTTQNIDDSLLEHIRKDPGVKCIEDNFLGEDDWDTDDDDYDEDHEDALTAETAAHIVE